MRSKSIIESIDFGGLAPLINGVSRQVEDDLVVSVSGWTVVVARSKNPKLTKDLLSPAGFVEAFHGDSASWWKKYELVYPFHVPPTGLFYRNPYPKIGEGARLEVLSILSEYGINNAGAADDLTSLFHWNSYSGYDEPPEARAEYDKLIVKIGGVLFPGQLRIEPLRLSTVSVNISNYGKELLDHFPETTAARVSKEVTRNLKTIGYR